MHFRICSFAKLGEHKNIWDQNSKEIRHEISWQEEFTKEQKRGRWLKVAEYNENSEKTLVEHVEDVSYSFGACGSLEDFKILQIIKVHTVAHNKRKLYSNCHHVEKDVYYVFVDLLLGEYVNAIIRTLIVIYWMRIQIDIEVKGIDGAL